MNTDHTLEEVGKQFDVTRERIRQIEAKALRKLRHPTRSDPLRSFLEIQYQDKAANVSTRSVCHRLAAARLLPRSMHKGL